MSVERLAIKSGFLLAGRLAEKTAQFLALIAVARSVSVEAYGTYSLAIYFTALCTILFDWGIQPYTIREVARDPSRASLLFRHGMTLKLAYVTSAIALLSLALLTIGYAPPLWRAIVVVFAGRVLLSFAQFNGALFRAHGKMHYEAIIALAGSAILLSGTLLSLRWSFGVLGLAVVWLLYGFAEMVMSFGLLFGRILPRGALPVPIDRRFLREVNKQSIVFGLCSACTLIYVYLDTIILSKMASLEIVSRYTAAYNFVLGLILVPQVLVDTLYPFLARRLLGENRPIGWVVSMISRYFLLIAVPAGLSMTLLSEPLIRFVYGAKYLGNGIGADRALAILVWDGCLIFFTYLFGQVLAVFGKQSRVTLIAVIGAFVNIVLNLILIPRFSLIGAAAATVATEFVNLILLVWSLRSSSLFEKGSIPVSQTAVGTLCMGAFFWEYGAQLSVVWSIASCVTVYGAALVLTGALRHSPAFLVKRENS